jgi:uncharacterized NAD(P)/FAD-binding protein YdhS
MKTQTIAIIGAGFCGSTLAVRLLRNPTGERIETVFIVTQGVHSARGDVE